jgi:hypothetical protein
MQVHSLEQALALKNKEIDYLSDQLDKITVEFENLNK